MRGQAKFLRIEVPPPLLYISLPIESFDRGGCWRYAIAMWKNGLLLLRTCHGIPFPLGYSLGLEPGLRVCRCFFLPGWLLRIKYTEVAIQGAGQWPRHYVRHSPFSAPPPLVGGGCDLNQQIGNPGVQPASSLDFAGVAVATPPRVW